MEVPTPRDLQPSRGYAGLMSGIFRLAIDPDVYRAT